MNSLSFFLLLLFTLFDICWAQQYYCIAGLGGGQLRCGPKAQNTGQTLDPYPSINLCCSDQRDDIDPLLISRIQIFDTKPPAALPTDCGPAISKITSKFECVPGRPNAFLHWHPFVQHRNDRAICCKGTPTNELDVYDNTLARPVPAGDVEIVFPPGQTPGPNPNPVPGPIPPMQTSATRRPMRPIVPFRPSRISSAFCRDLTIPGRPFDCAANADRCIDPLYVNLMAQQCPATCNLCGRLRQQNPLGGGGGVIDRHIGGGRGCRDWIPPSGHMSCQQMVANLYCQNHRTQMVAQCPVSCGFCTPSFGMK